MTLGADRNGHGTPPRAAREKPGKGERRAVSSGRPTLLSRDRPSYATGRASAPQSGGRGDFRDQPSSPARKQANPSTSRSPISTLPDGTSSGQSHERVGTNALPDPA